MRGALRPSARPAGSLTLEALDALRAIEAITETPILLGYHPVARLNPFQALLYGAAWDAGIAPVPVVGDEAIDELAAIAGLGVPTVLHLHWLNHPRRDAGTTLEAEHDADAFIARLDRFLERGGRIAWTVHNVLPHDSSFGALEARVHQAVADRAAVVHVLAEETPAHVAARYSIPQDRVMHVPHPSYAGAYEDHVSRQQARHELGLMPDERVFVVLGAIRPYKGIDQLLDAWAALPAGTPRRLVIGGAPGEDPATLRLLERATLDPTVLVHPRQIPSSQVQLFLRSADVMVLPYVEALNSGAMLLALTFGVPVIVPDGPLGDAVDPSFSIVYRRHEAGSLREALLGADGLATDAARSAAREAALARDPLTLSRRFAAGLRARLEADGPW